MIGSVKGQYNKHSKKTSMTFTKRLVTIVFVHDNVCYTVDRKVVKHSLYCLLS